MEPSRRSSKNQLSFLVGKKMSLRPVETIQLTQFYFRVIMKAYIVLLYGKQEWKFNIY